MTGERINCCVPFCRRTRKPWKDADSDHRWVCGPHWRHVSKTKKRRMTKALKRWNKITARGERHVHNRPARRWADIWYKTFDACCTEAIQAAAGIG